MTTAVTEERERGLAVSFAIKCLQNRGIQVYAAELVEQSIWVGRPGGINSRRAKGRSSRKGQGKDHKERGEEESRRGGGEEEEEEERTGQAGVERENAWAVVLGDEFHGVSPRVLSVVDAAVAVRQWCGGDSDSSLNVGHAAAIVLHEASKRMRHREEEGGGEEG